MNLRHSIVLRRTFFLIILSIVFSCFLQMIWFTFLSNQFKNNNTMQDMKEKVTWLAEQSKRLKENTISRDAFDATLTSSSVLSKTNVFVYFKKSLSAQTPIVHPNTQWTVEEIQESVDLIKSKTEQMRADVMAVQTKIGTKGNVIFVGAPITEEKKDEFGNTIINNIGSVFIFSPFDETNWAPILLSSLAAFTLTFLMILFPALYIINLIVMPLFRIRDVAKRISERDFSHKVKENYKSEFGELARSINQMSHNLQVMINTLETESKRLSLILNGLNEGIVSFSKDLDITHINPMFMKFFPEAANLEVGMHLTAIAVPQLIEHIEYAIKKDQATTFVLPRGERFLLCQIIILKSNVTNEIRGLVSLFRDITEESRLEQTRKDYVANISHELKTPLTAMRCLVEPMLDDMVPDESTKKRYYHIMYDETLRLSRLIDDMLELSRLQSGLKQFTMEPIDLDPMLKSLKERFTPICQDAKIDFNISVVDPLPLLYTAPDRIEQIIIILLDNAIKFTPTDGHITIGVEKINEKQVQIFVKNSGQGIDPEDVEHVFERFYKADKSRGSTGTGLGLSIAKEIIELMGQKIWVVSTLGNGATFYITLAIYTNQDDEIDENKTSI